MRITMWAAFNYGNAIVSGCICRTRWECVDAVRQGASDASWDQIKRHYQFRKVVIEIPDPAKEGA